MYGWAVAWSDSRHMCFRAPHACCTRRWVSERMTSSASSSLPPKSDFLDTPVTAVTHQPMLSYALSLTAGILPYGAVLMGKSQGSLTAIRWTLLWKLRDLVHPFPLQSSASTSPRKYSSQPQSARVAGQPMWSSLLSGLALKPVSVS